MRHLAFHARLIELALQAGNAAGCFPGRGRPPASGRCQSAGNVPLRHAFAGTIPSIHAFVTHRPNFTQHTDDLFGQWPLSHKPLGT
jgi:hypothetical protein